MIIRNIAEVRARMEEAPPPWTANQNRRYSNPSGRSPGIIPVW